MNHCNERVSSSKRMKYAQYAIVIVCLIACVVFGFVANEARKEVFYLCQNFTPGTSLESVVRQLSTLTFSEYEILNTQTGKKIVHSSALNLYWVSCEIVIDNNDTVVSASYR